MGIETLVLWTELENNVCMLWVIDHLGPFLCKGGCGDVDPGRFLIWREFRGRGDGRPRFLNGTTLGTPTEMVFGIHSYKQHGMH